MPFTDDAPQGGEAKRLASGSPGPPGMCFRVGVTYSVWTMMNQIDLNSKETSVLTIQNRKRAPKRLLKAQFVGQTSGWTHAEDGGVHEGAALWNFSSRNAQEQPGGACGSPDGSFDCASARPTGPCYSTVRYLAFRGGRLRDVGRPRRTGRLELWR